MCSQRPWFFWYGKCFKKSCVYSFLEKKWVEGSFPTMPSILIIIYQMEVERIKTRYLYVHPKILYNIWSSDWRGDGYCVLILKGSQGTFSKGSEAVLIINENGHNGSEGPCWVESHVWPEKHRHIKDWPEQTGEETSTPRTLLEILSGSQTVFNGYLQLAGRR